MQIPDWCGCSTEYLPLPTGDDWWWLVPIWEPAQTPNRSIDGSRPSRTGRVTGEPSPLRRYGPPEPR